MLDVIPLMSTAEAIPAPITIPVMAVSVEETKESAPVEGNEKCATDLVIVADEKIKAIKTSRPRVDLGAHEGIRGIAALWVMIFHCFIFSKYPIDFQGSSIMVKSLSSFCFPTLPSSSMHLELSYSPSSNV